MNFIVDSSSLWSVAKVFSLLLTQYRLGHAQRLQLKQGRPKSLQSRLELRTGLQNRHYYSKIDRVNSDFDCLEKSYLL